MIRWDESIEAVHEDGRTMKVGCARKVTSSMMSTDQAPFGAHPFWNLDGTERASGYPSGWRIRNVTAPTPPNTPAGYSDEVVERAMALVRRMADATGFATWLDHRAEARAIVALLPEPVSVDLAEAQRIVDGCGINPDDPEYYAALGIADEAIRRGRALAAEGR